MIRPRAPFRLLPRPLLVLASLLLALPLAAQVSSLNQLSNEPARPRPLSLEQAFPWFVSEAGSDRLLITWQPAAGHYLYRHAFAFALQTGDGAPSPLTAIIPDGLKKTDQFFGDIEAYYGQTAVELSLPAGRETETELVIEYQGCADWGFCYPPQRVIWPLPAN